MRKETFTEENYYHIYNRGVDKRSIFTDQSEYLRFANNIYVLNNFQVIPRRFDIYRLEPRELLTPIKPYTEITAVCLMPNHYHLMISPLQKNGISAFLHKLGTSYTKYFNIRHARKGRLFESTFHAKHVDREEYASYLTQYIHLNPVKLFLRHETNPDSILSMVKKYEWSTLPDYLGGEGRFSHTVASSKFRDDILGLDAKEYQTQLKEIYTDIISSQPLS